MKLDDLLQDLSDAFGNYAVLNELVSDARVDVLLHEAAAQTPEQAELDPTETWRLITGLETVDWTYAETERLGWMPKQAPRHPKHLPVRRASVALRCLLARDTEQMPQSALNVCIRAYVEFPEAPVFAQHARDLFRAYGEQMGESLSIDEAFFSVMKATKETDALRAQLTAIADDAGWTG